MGRPLTAGELIEAIRRRGGDVRRVGDHVQYRPAGVLTDDELSWVARHLAELARALGDCNQADEPAVSALPATPPLGIAGPGVDAWHCWFAISSHRPRSEQSEGAVSCGTCSPRTLGRLS